MKNFIYLIFIQALVFSCQSDGIDGNENIEENRRNAINFLTSNNESKVWKIESAKIIKNNQEIDVTELFNVQDDEFVFSFSNTLNLVWKPRHIVNLNANNLEEAQVESIISPKNYQLNFEENLSNKLNTTGNQISFEISNNTLMGIIKTDGITEAGLMRVVLKEKSNNFYPSAPQNLLFEELYSYPFDVNGSGPSFISSKKRNALFVANKASNSLPIVITTYDLATNQMTNYNNTIHQLSSFGMQIKHNSLFLATSNQIFKYDLNNMSNAPIVTNHQNYLTRFGTAIINNDIYLTSGDVEDASNANKIYRFDIQNSSTNTAPFLLSQAKYGGSSTILDNNMYVFGGTLTFGANNPDTSSNKIVKINLNDNMVSEITMPKAAQYTYTTNHDHLIYVGGHLREFENMTLTNNEIYIGVFNTITGTFTVINHNLDSHFQNQQLKCIRGLTILNNKLYVLVSDNFQNGKILKVNL